MLDAIPCLGARRPPLGGCLALLCGFSFLGKMEEQVAVEFPHYSQATQDASLARVE